MRNLSFYEIWSYYLFILVYSNATVHVNTLVYDGLIEEIVNTLKHGDVGHRLAVSFLLCQNLASFRYTYSASSRAYNFIYSTDPHKFAYKQVHIHIFLRWRSHLGYRVCVAYPTHLDNPLCFIYLKLSTKLNREITNC